MNDAGSQARRKRNSAVDTPRESLLRTEDCITLVEMMLLEYDRFKGSRNIVMVCTPWIRGSISMLCSYDHESIHTVIKCYYNFNLRFNHRF